MIKVTKRALLSSALALLVCVSMLIGTTFAWFTDSVTSANNVIKSGNLDIELEYWDGDSWEDVSGRADVLTNNLFEPGVTEIAYLRLANAGSLALKYQLGINIVSEKEGTNAAGETFKLSDYVMFGVVENVNGETGAYANREDAVADIDSAKKISAGYTKAASMNDGDELYFALVVYMPETVGNVANHNGVDVPQIDLGLNVFATQYTFESDSFDQYYDGEASVWSGEIDTEWYFNDPDATEFVIGNAEQFAGFAALVNGTAGNGVTTFAARSTPAYETFEGQTIKLASNIDLNNLAWTPIGNWDNAFEGNFDGQGHTISNLYIDDADGEGVGLFGVVAKATIKNLTIKNVDINAYSMVAGLVGAAYPAVIENCHVTGNINIVAEWAYVAGIAGYCYYETQVNECSTIATGDASSKIESVTRNAVGGITAWLLEGNHTVTNCEVKNLDLIGWSNVGGITGFVHYSNTISGCTVENVNLIKTRADGNPGIGLIAGGWSYNANHAITLSNNTISNASLDGTHIAYSAYNVLYGSEYGGATTTNFVLENNTVDNVTNNLVEVTKATTTAALADAVKVEGVTVYVPAGTYTFPSNVAKNVTILCAEGVEFTGSSKLNINGSTVIGATFSNNGNIVNQSTINGVFVDCTFIGAIRSAIAGETVEFNNCVFDGPLYGVHFDSGANDVVLNNCTLSGFNTFGAALTSLTLNNCTFVSNGKSGYNGINLWGNTVMKNCTFVFDNSVANEWVDIAKTNNKTVTFENCVVNDGTNERALNGSDVGDYGTNNTIIIDGARIVAAPISVDPAPYKGECYEEGTNVAAYKDMTLTGNAYISINSNASVAVENVISDVNGSVIVMKDYQPAIYVSGGEFTIGEGEYLIDASAVEGGVYQIFLVNVKVNGEYLTQESAAQYLKNVNWYGAYIFTE